MRFLALQLFLTALSLPVGAASYYVAPGGDDKAGDGSAEKPWAAIQKGADALQPGDTLFLRSGLYAQRLALNVSGTKDAPITVFGEAGAVLTGEGAKRSAPNMITIADQSFIRITGLEIRDTQSGRESHGIHVDGGCEEIVIDKCHIHHLKGKLATAIGVYGNSAEKPIQRVTISGCHIHDCEPADSETVVVNGNVDGFVIEGNHIHDVNNIGIDVIGGESDVIQDKTKVARNGVIRGNKVERARSNYGGGYAAGIYVDGGRAVMVERNTVTGCDLGIEIGAENRRVTTAGITVRYNKVYRNDKAGIVFGGYDRARGRVTGCAFNNNLLWHNTLLKNAEAEIWIQEASENTVSGNIVVTRPQAKLVSAVDGGVENRLNNNIYYCEAGAEAMHFTWGVEDGRGLKEWQRVSGQDAGSKFKAPDFPRAEAGDFGVLPWERP